MFFADLFLSPVTGEHVNPAPFIFGALALILIVAMIVLSGKGKNKPNDPAPQETPTDDTDNPQE